jgi:hypothetical protein
VDVSLSEDFRIVASKEQVSCNLAGEAAILSLKNGVYYGLNPVGSRIWNLIQTPRTFGELRTILLNEYNVEATELEQDMARLFRELSEHKLVEIGAPEYGAL